MKFPKILAAALLAGSTTLAAAAPVSAAPLAHDSGLSSATGGNVTNVQWRGRHGGHWHGHRHHHHGWRRGGGWGPALGGLAAGAIIGGAIASSQAQAAHADAVAYCSQRYRSYDPASGTYLNNDGNRYPCP